MTTLGQTRLSEAAQPYPSHETDNRSGIRSAFDSVIRPRCSHLSSIQSSTLPPLPPLLSAVFGRGATDLPQKQPVEEGHLGEATGQGDVQDTPFAIAEFASRRLQPKLIHEGTKTMPRVLLELPGKRGATQARDFE
jgi:hypothetical protein